MALSGELLPWQGGIWRRLMQAHKQGRLPHGLLLAGPAGIGKRHLAQVLVERLLCTAAQGEQLACGACKSCQLMAAGTHPDLCLVAPEEGKKLISVNQIRELRERLVQTAQQGRYRVALIAPADAMNVNAANALLKTLEEPGADTVLVLVTARPQAVPVTVRSRCQRVPLDVPNIEDGLSWLRLQGVPASDAEEALDEAGAPLSALALLKSGEMARQSEFWGLLDGVAQGRVEPVTAAARLPADAAPVLLGAFARHLGALVRGQAERGEKPQAGLFRILDKVTEARALLLNNANVNAQLLLESLLVAWFELHAKLRHSR